MGSELVDLVVASTVAALGFGALHVGLRRRGAGGVPLGVALLVPCLVACGALAAHRAIQREVDRLEDLLLGYGSTYAVETARHGHAAIPTTAPVDDPRVVDLMDLQREWLRANPTIADVYTLRREREGQYWLVVDSDTDYNRDGDTGDEREGRTVPGQAYAPNEIRAVERAFAGSAAFCPQVIHDWWGEWVSAFAPVPDGAGGVDAVLGVDFPAVEWNRRVANTRLNVWAGVGLIGILLGGSTAVVSSVRTESEARRLLNQRLQGALEEARQAREVADRANRAKSIFLANMSHEIRTPMTAVLGLTEMAIRTRDDDERRSYLQAACDSALSLVEILNRIIDLARIEAGVDPDAPRPFHLDALVSGVLQTYQGRADQAGVRLLARVSPEVPPRVMGEADRIRQVLLNLVGNAIKFSRGGDVTLTVEPAPPAAGRDHVRFLVEDQGAGIPIDKLGLLFHDYGQVEPEVARRQGGSGLGLAICRKLVERMGGRIDVRSAPGRGSAFWFDLALRDAREGSEPPPPPDPVEDQPPVEPSTDRVDGAEAVRTLIVEDDTTTRRLLEHLLSTWGFPCQAVATGGDAIAAYVETPYELVLLDGQLPDMGGEDVATALRDIERDRPGPTRTRIVAVTGHAMKGDEDRFLSHGMDGYLAKPFTLSMLRQAIDRARATREGNGPSRVA